LAVALSSTRPFPITGLVRARRAGLGPVSRRARVVHEDFEPLGSCDSFCTFGGYHGPHLVAKFRGHLDVDERLPDCGRKLALITQRCSTSVACHSLCVG